MGTKKEKFERIVFVKPAFDKRSNDPSKDYGISACRIVFILKGKRGAVQFMIGTNWYVPSAREHLKKLLPSCKDTERKPEGWDVGYHSHKKMYNGQEPVAYKCEILGGKCYYDGSGLRADAWIEDFVAGGTDWLWPKLEEEYRNTFIKKPKIR